MKIISHCRYVSYASLHHTESDKKVRYMSGSSVSSGLPIVKVPDWIRIVCTPVPENAALIVFIVALLEDEANSCARPMIFIAVTRSVAFALSIIEDSNKRSISYIGVVAAIVTSKFGIGTFTSILATQIFVFVLPTSVTNVASDRSHVIKAAAKFFCRSCNVAIMLITSSSVSLH